MTVTPTVSDPSKATIEPASVTIAPATWNTERFFDVLGVAASGTPVVVSHPAVSEDADYHSSMIDSFAVTVDPAGRKLVSNTAQAGGVGRPENFTSRSAAQAFTTGPQDYTLSSIDLNWTISSPLTAEELRSLAVVLETDNGGDPSGTRLTTLRNPATVETGTARLRAPAGVTLAANTTYHLRVFGTDRSGKMSYVLTFSDDEDSGSVSGWSISDGYTVFTLNERLARTASWQIGVNGFRPASDADLASLLAVGSESTDGSGFDQDITLSPSFDAATTAYTATVANAVSRVKLIPRAEHRNASVTVAGTEVAGGAASGAVNLSEGANNIEVTVTAAGRLHHQDLHGHHHQSGGHADAAAGGQFGQTLPHASKRCSAGGLERRRHRGDDSASCLAGARRRPRHAGRPTAPRRQ